MAADAKILDEDEETGLRRFRYVRTGENHFSLAFTYAWLAAIDQRSNMGLFYYYRQLAKGLGNGEVPKHDPLLEEVL
jgi:hypothetical protein